MPQTLLAILALMIVSYMTFTANRQVVDAQRGMVANELEVMATGVALRAMETIRTRAFDQAVLDEEKPTKDDFEYNNSTDHFYVKSGGCKVFGGSQDCDAIDDFHMSADTDPATLYFDMEGEQIPFEVRAEVQYVDPDSLDRYNGRTYHKEVTVYVQDKRDEGQRHFLNTPAQMSRTFSYNFVTGNTTQSDDSGGTEQSGGDGGDDEASLEDFLNHLLDKYSDKGWMWVYGKAMEDGWLKSEYQAWRATRD